MRTIVMIAALVISLAAKADYWMTFCKTPGGQQYAQVGYVKPDADGFVTIKAGLLRSSCTRHRYGIRRCPAKRRDADAAIPLPQALVHMRSFLRAKTACYK